MTRRCAGLLKEARSPFPMHSSRTGRTAAPLLAFLLIVVFGAVTLYLSYEGLQKRETRVLAAWEELRAPLQEHMAAFAEYPRPVPDEPGLQSLMRRLQELAVRWGEADERAERVALGIEAHEQVRRFFETYARLHDGAQAPEAWQQWGERILNPSPELESALEAYNDAVTVYNIQRTRFPGSFVGPLAGMEVYTKLETERDDS